MMTVTGLPLVLSALAVVMVLVAIRLCFRRSWLAGFLRGLLSLLLLFAASGILLAAYDLYSYRHLVNETPAADLRFEQTGDQEYRVTIQLPQGKELSSYTLKGDYWQLDARFIKWNSLILRSGIEPLFRLERLSGRYRDIHDEQYAPRTVFAVESSPWLDVWQLIQKSKTAAKLVDTEYGSATYLPMQHQAHYRVFVTTHGLMARPFNSPAKEAIDNWSS